MFSSSVIPVRITYPYSTRTYGVLVQQYGCTYCIRYSYLRYSYYSMVHFPSNLNSTSTWYIWRNRCRCIFPELRTENGLPHDSIRRARVCIAVAIGRLGESLHTGTISSTWIEKMENRTRLALYSSTKILHIFFFLRIAPLAITYILQYICSSYILNRFVLIS